MIISLPKTICIHATPVTEVISLLIPPPLLSRPSSLEGLKKKHQYRLTMTRRTRYRPDKPLNANNPTGGGRNAADAGKHSVLERVARHF